MSLVLLRDEGSGSVPAMEYTAAPETVVNVIAFSPLSCYTLLRLTNRVFETFHS